MTTPQTIANNMADRDLGQKITRIQAQHPLRSRQKCIETLDIVNDDVEKALAFLAGIEGLSANTATNEQQSVGTAAVTGRATTAA